MNSAPVRTTGVEGASRMVAKQYGGPDLSADITGDAYHVLTIPQIPVTSGKCEIGFFTQGDAGLFCW